MVFREELRQRSFLQRDCQCGGAATTPGVPIRIWSRVMGEPGFTPGEPIVTIAREACARVRGWDGKFHSEEYDRKLPCQGRMRSKDVLLATDGSGALKSGTTKVEETMPSSIQHDIS